MDDDLVFSPPSLQDAKKNRRGQHVKQAMIGPSVDEPLSVSLSVFSRWGGAPQSVTPSNAPPFSLSLSLSLSRLVVFRASNSLEGVVLLVQPSSAAVVDEHVQEHHRFLSLSVCRARARRSSTPSRAVAPGFRLILALPSFSNPK